MRHSAQTVFGIIILGLGPLLSGPVLGKITEISTRQTTVKQCVATVNLVPIRPADSPTDAAKGWDKKYSGAEQEVRAYEAAYPDDQSRSWRALRPETNVAALDYATLWRIVAGFAVVSALLLAAAFKLDPVEREATEI